MAELSISRIVNIKLLLSPVGAKVRDLSTLLIIGDSDVLHGNEWIRSYDTLDDVVRDFGTSLSEYKGAQLVFGQNPSPGHVTIGRWFRTASKGVLVGGKLTDAQQDPAEWRKVKKGAFKIYLNGGSAATISNIDLSAVDSLNAVAAAISAKTSGATLVWNLSTKSFIFSSDATGATSQVKPLETASVSDNTELAPLLKMNENTMTLDEKGVNAESPLQCVNRFLGSSSDWYGVTFCAATMPSDSEFVEVGKAINSIPSDKKARMLGCSTSNESAFNKGQTNDLGNLFYSENLKKANVQWSKNKFAVVSYLARLFGSGFTANNSMITMMFKQEPEVTPESLTGDQADVLSSKHYNVYARYDNNTSIIQYGIQSDGSYTDEVYGIDWLVNRLQTNCYNVLYTNPTKVPQTDGGQNILLSSVSATMEEAVAIGLIAPGQWNAAGFGELHTGDFLKKGYYVYSIPMAQQPQVDREARKSVPIQIAGKLKGAIHEADVVLFINR